MEERRTPTRRPDDWLFDTLSRMEATEMRHAQELRSSIIDVLKRFDQHAKDDSDFQLGIQGKVQHLEDAAIFQKESYQSRQAWLIVIASSSSALLMWLADRFIK